MAQVLKDEIRDNILRAALEEFFEKGYKSAAMRSIAQKANIPTGLIYSYYKNKEALFDAVLSPVLYNWKLVLNASDDGHSEEVNGLSRAETDCLLNLFEHREECIILFDKSYGTKYETQKAMLINAIEEHLNRHKKDTASDEIFIHIIASNFVDGLMQVMYHYKGKEWAAMILHKLSEMYLLGIGY